MATAYPAAIDSFVAKQDNVDDVEAVNINDLQEAIEALETKVGVTSSAVTASLDYKVNNFFATGRKVYLYENTAPTGWSITAVTDKVLAVKGGSDAYNATGGTAAGTWTQPSHTHPIASGGHSVRTGTDGDFCFDDSPGANQHLYGISTSAGATAATYRPTAAVGIICTKA